MITQAQKCLLELKALFVADDHPKDKQAEEIIDRYLQVAFDEGFEDGANEAEMGS